MAESERTDTIPLGAYTAEMQAELDRLATLISEEVDFSRAPDAAMRALDERNSAVWNIDPPPVASVRHVRISADEALDAAPCDAVIYTPENAGHGVIFYVHGGGWALNNLATHESLMRALCNETRMTLVGVHYRLAPENPYPAALMDVISAFRRIVSCPTEFGLPEGPVVIAGDSAGANLAMATMLHEIGAERPLPAGALLFYGVFGADFDTLSYRAYADGHRLTTAIMRRFWDWYIANEARRDDPLAAPLKASDAQLRALPPLFLLAAEMDPLASDSYDLKRRLDGLGRDDALIVEPGVIHGFMQMTAVLEAARKGMRAAGRAANRFVAIG